MKLPNTASLYKFENVGAIIKIAKASSVKIKAIFGKEFVEITVPEGNWVLVNVGAMPDLEEQGVSKVDNPFAPTPESKNNA